MAWASGRSERSVRPRSSTYAYALSSSSSRLAVTRAMVTETSVSVGGSGMGVAIRPADRPGDLGWMVWQHGEVYAATLGWDTSFEALVARIVADFATADPDPRLAGWIGELDGRRVGCVLCVPGPEPHVAVLRILLVTPQGRGHGAGRSLVDACVDHATQA